MFDMPTTPQREEQKSRSARLGALQRCPAGYPDVGDSEQAVRHLLFRPAASLHYLFINALKEAMLILPCPERRYCRLPGG